MCELLGNTDIGSTRKYLGLGSVMKSVAYFAYIVDFADFVRIHTACCITVSSGRGSKCVGEYVIELVSKSP